MRGRRVIGDMAVLAPDVYEVVSRYSLLDGLLPDECRDFVAHGRFRQVQHGAYFFHQDEPADLFYILISGQVKLTQITPDGHQVILHYFGPGDGIGIIVVLGGMDYPASAYAMEDCTALSWNRETTQTLMRRYPQLALNGMEIVARRFAMLQKRYQELATQRVEQRVALTLLRLVRQFGKRTEDGVLIDIPLSRQDLGEMTGTNLYNVSRILRKWEKAGLVHIGRQQVALCQPHELVVIAEGIPQ
ncbi:MAG TPA: Crp/Fnr family transcriptional regulator [Anaerolineae bacterium]|nr:Crp/Fnr family transcriptional regulator [Anaerolineae bacterium]